MSRMVVVGARIVTSSIVYAVDLAGWWRAQDRAFTASPPQIVQVTQTGDTVTIPVTLSSFAGQLTGTIIGVGEFNLIPVAAASVAAAPAAPGGEWRLLRGTLRQQRRARERRGEQEVQGARSALSRGH
jgi:hypothetical protein